MGNPAARLGDSHVCPASPGTVPHVGGPLLPPAQATVNINGVPAARVTDTAVCVGPPDAIAAGSATVNIANQAAAYVGSSTAHGGSVTTGSPDVNIGG
jgi:uncharacterized Zn-binding protein involved in type VI secretion